MSTELNIYDIIRQLIVINSSVDKVEKDGFIRHLKPIDDLVIDEPPPSENALTSIRYTLDRDMYPITTTITNEILFQYCIEIPGEEFIRRFNKTIYDYIYEKFMEAKTKNVPDDDNIWMQPNAAFVNWFQEEGIDINTTLSLNKEVISNIEKEDTNNSLWAIADDMRKRKEDGEFETYREAYRWAEDNMTQNGKAIKWERLENAYQKAKSAAKLD